MLRIRRIIRKGKPTLKNIIYPPYPPYVKRKGEEIHPPNPPQGGRELLASQIHYHTPQINHLSCFGVCERDRETHISDFKSKGSTLLFKQSKKKIDFHLTFTTSLRSAHVRSFKQDESIFFSSCLNKSRKTNYIKPLNIAYPLILCRRFFQDNLIF